MIRLDAEKYLNLPDVRSIIGVESHMPAYEMTSHMVSRAFNGALDISHQTYYYVANLLERGVRVLNVSLPDFTVYQPAFRPISNLELFKHSADLVYPVLNSMLGHWTQRATILDQETLDDGHAMDRAEKDTARLHGMTGRSMATSPGQIKTARQLDGESLQFRTCLSIARDRRHCIVKERRIISHQHR